MGSREKGRQGGRVGGVSVGGMKRGEQALSGGSPPTPRGGREMGPSPVGIVARGAGRSESAAAYRRASSRRGEAAAAGAIES